MSTDCSGVAQGPSPGSRVHCDGLADDKAIADEFADGLAGVGIGDFVDLVRIKPDLALATADHGSGEALLRPKIDPVVNCMSVQV